ncbi:hypothetical protein Shewana3_3495 [Shewanella sp. ANA-3]|uniref:hypothetical protein n=1 Tax=Shewanella sp. (strain ANA-3) TaxID=94122 RepID=UPI00005E0316|nr:hypothetical protein [Shewanella sp. ANA-3]ABK49718.1 hypothetical protein Shewana3_3495 [Shewanella sp. ANA-3]
MTIKHEIPALKQVQQMLKANQASINGELEELNRQWYALRDNYEGEGAENTEGMVMDLGSWLEEYTNKLFEFETRLQQRIQHLENLKPED